MTTASSRTVGLTRYEFTVPSPGEFKDVMMALSWATDKAKELGLSTEVDNWIYFEGDEEEVVLYFEVDSDGRATCRSGR